MGYKKLLCVSLLLTLLGLSACSTEPDDVIGHLDGDGNRYSPTTLGGTVEYLHYLEPEKVMIVPVDEKLKALDSFEVSNHYINLLYYNFTVKSRDYEQPFVKVVTVFPLSKKKKMELYHYVRLTSANDDIKIVFYRALVAGRIETLVRKEHYTFDEAEEKAYAELGQIVNVNLDVLYKSNFKTFKDVYGYDVDKWRSVLAPYVLCRHEVSDSVFYSDYKEFRDAFAKKGTVDASMLVRAADAWLSTFEVRQDNENTYLFHSVSRDSSEDLKFMDTTFFEKAYGLNCSWSRDSVVKIENKKSAFYGRSFVKDEYYNSLTRYTEYRWRLQTLFEDTVGTCLKNRESEVQYKGDYYLCRYNSHQWKKETNVDTLLRFKYGGCGKSKQGSSAYIGDSSFVCYCDNNGKCGWKVVEALSQGDSAYAEKLDVLATKKFGKCKEVLHFGGEVKKMDSLFVQCSNYKWVEIDSLSYYMGVCPGENFGKIEKIPSGDYYECGYDGWEYITIPEVKKDPCDWKTDSTYKNYDGKYFYCVDGQWKKVAEEEVIKPVLKGDSCNVDSASVMRNYGDEYFICRTGASGKMSSNHWSVATIQERELYRIKLRYVGLCSHGRTGTALVWSDSAQSLYGCVDSGSSGFELARAVVAAKDTAQQREIESIGQSSFAKGGFIENATYEVEIDSVVYGFRSRDFEWNDWKRTGWDDHVIMNLSYKGKRKAE